MDGLGGGEKESIPTPDLLVHVDHHTNLHNTGQDSLPKGHHRLSPWPAWPRSTSARW